MKIEIYDKAMNRIWLSILMFLIWLLGTAIFFGVFWVIAYGFNYLFGIGISSQILLILATVIGGPFSIFAIFYIRSSSRYSSNGNGLDFRDWWLIFGHNIDFGDEKAKKLNLEEVDKWASENCSSLWRRRNKSYYPIWVFKDESEAMAFKLRWS